MLVHSVAWGIRTKIYEGKALSVLRKGGVQALLHLYIRVIDLQIWP
jgi:hypothetical protein